MKIQDALENAKEFWAEYRKVGSGLVGLAILLVFVIMAIVGPAVVPFPGATEHWHDITFWKDNPQSAPPAWSNLFRSRKGAVSEALLSPAKRTEAVAGGEKDIYTFKYRMDADHAPRDLIFRFKGTGSLPVSIEARRPDGSSGEIYSSQLALSGTDYRRISIERDGQAGVTGFVNQVDEDVAMMINPNTVQPCDLLFSNIDMDMADNPTTLKGEYEFDLSLTRLAASVTVQPPELLVSGDVAGILGTDASKRDVFTGLIVGIRWALLIGLLTSILTVIVGVVLGVMAAYFGGVTDWLLNRLYEYIYLMPVLPFLIVVSAIFKPSIWFLIFIICLFFWTGPYKPVYSMALQIKEETFVEASKALGASKWRIIFTHILPILLPYSFAVMALSIPSVIVYEASVSLLGLGDTTIVTWGQILHDALSQGAVINNLWWWVIPPGLAIALMGMSFAFIGSAMDKILHPKLKTR